MIKPTIGNVVQFNENHKWRGSFGFVSNIEPCGDDFRVMVGCTMPDNETGCDTAYIFSMLSKGEFDVVGNAVMMPQEGEDG